MLLLSFDDAGTIVKHSKTIYRTLNLSQPGLCLVRIYALPVDWHGSARSNGRRSDIQQAA
jgi:hypothetical protein